MRLIFVALMLILAVPCYAGTPGGKLFFAGYGVSISGSYGFEGGVLAPFVNGNSAWGVTSSNVRTGSKCAAGSTNGTMSITGNTGAGNYTLWYKVATAGVATVTIDGTLAGTLSTFTTYTQFTTELSAGYHTINIDWVAGTVYIDDIVIP